MVKQVHGECILDTGNYIFNTEAHPIDADALKCCYDQPHEQLIPSEFSSDDYLGEIMQSQQRHQKTNVISAATMNMATDDSERDVNAAHSVDSSSNRIIISVDEDDEVDEADYEDYNESVRADEIVTGTSKVERSPTKSEYEIVTEINKLASTKYKNITEVLESSLDTVSEWLKSENARSELLKLIGELETTSEQIKSPTIETVTTTVDENHTGEIQIDGVDNGKSNSYETLRNKQPQDGQTKTDWLPAMRPEEVLHETPADTEESSSAPREFDVQRLVEKVRRMYSRVKRQQDFELLSCRSQSYLQRLAIHGEMLT